MIVIDNNTVLETMQGVINDFLIPKFISLGMNASGQWINSLEARAENGRGEIWGRDYTYYLVNGRAGGKRPPITPLISWVGYKFGLYGNEAKSAAFAIANKIAKEGTEYYPNGTDLLEVLQSDEVKQYVYDKIGIAVAGQIQSQIRRDLTNIFA